jgi:hypothetical protein
MVKQETNETKISFEYIKNNVETIKDLIELNKEILKDE